MEDVGKTVVVTRQESEGAEEAANPTKGVPLFQGEGSEAVHTISVYRVAPVEEGSLPGGLPPEADEAMVFTRYGGGIYKITAKGSNGRIMGTRTITISGEPKFQSKEALRKYRVQLGELPEERPAPPAPPPPAPGLGIMELFALMSKSQEQQMQMMRIQIEATNAANAEREARARREAEEREARLRREAEESRERDRQFHAMMLTMVKADAKTPSDGSSAVKLLLQGLALGRELHGESGPTDPLSLLMGNAPAIIEHLKGMTGPGAAAGPPALPPTTGPRIVLTGESATRLQAAIKTLMGKGYSQEQATGLAEQAFGHTVQMLEQIPNAAPAAPPTTVGQAASDLSTPASAPPPPPPLAMPDVRRNGTRARVRATR